MITDGLPKVCRLGSFLRALTSCFLAVAAGWRLGFAFGPAFVAARLGEFALIIGKVTLKGLTGAVRHLPQSVRDQFHEVRIVADQNHCPVIGVEGLH